jgi:hypothetical protein
MNVNISFNGMDDDNVNERGGHDQCSDFSNCKCVIQFMEMVRDRVYPKEKAIDPKYDYYNLGNIARGIVNDYGEALDRLADK